MISKAKRGRIYLFPMKNRSVRHLIHSEKPLVKKLGVEEADHVLLLDAPEGWVRPQACCAKRTPLKWALARSQENRQLMRGCDER